MGVLNIIHCFCWSDCRALSPKSISCPATWDAGIAACHAREGKHCLTPPSATEFHRLCCPVPAKWWAVYGPRKCGADQKTVQCFHQNYAQEVYFAHSKPFSFLCCHCRIFPRLEGSLHLLQYVGGNNQLHLGFRRMNAVVLCTLEKFTSTCSSCWKWE